MAHRWIRGWLLGLALWLPAAEAGWGNGAGCFWRVDGKDGSVLHVFGSIHFAKPDVYPLPASVVQAFDSAETVVFETDLDALSSPDTARKQARISFYAGNESLADHVSADTMTKLEAAAAKLGFSPSHFAKFRPWHCANTLAMTGLKQAGFDPALGLDQHFFRKATNEGKTVVGLEEPDLLLNLFGGMAAPAAEEYLRLALDELDEIKVFAPKLVRTWQAGDTEALKTLVFEGLKASPFLYRRLFLERNRAWLSRLRELGRPGNEIFVVVGAGHLVGPESLLELLRRDGASVRQL